MGTIAILSDASTRMRKARYGVNSFEGYVEEVLGRLRIPFRVFDSLEDALEWQPDILIPALFDENADNRDKLQTYVKNGGTVVSYAGLKGMAEKLGYCEERPLGAGYAVLPEGPAPIRFLSATGWSKLAGQAPGHKASGALRIGSPSGIESGPALLSIPWGEGTFERWSVDIVGTIVALQQGTGPVYDDGASAPDGTIPVQDDTLKADDRCAMDWEFDRLTTATGIPYFAFPYADWWRAAMVRHLIELALSKGKTLPFLGYWPAGIPAVTAISHDSDLNRDEHAKAALELLREVGIRSTWCMLEPGYSPAIYDQMKADGHDISLHYNALKMDGGLWSEEAFRRQSEWLKASAGIDRISSNKNHYTRFEGWGELFRWCESNGIESDQTRGPSKKGNTGLLFGTCHPYFPVSDFTEGNRLYDVLEIGFLSQDLNHPQLYDSSLVDPFLDIIGEAEGLAHFLFHQAHIFNFEAVRQAVREVVAGAQKRGYALWTIDQVNEWERARRKVDIAGFDESGKPIPEGAPLPQSAVVYVPVTDDERSPDGIYEKRFGVRCRKYIIQERIDENAVGNGR